MSSVPEEQCAPTDSTTEENERFRPWLGQSPEFWRMVWECAERLHTSPKDVLARAVEAFYHKTPTRRNARWDSISAEDRSAMMRTMAEKRWTSKQRKDDGNRE